MNAFLGGIQEQKTRTDNGMVARETTANKCVDFFFQAGASRGKDIIPHFVAAYVEEPELALRIALHLRDIREGRGERQLFKDILAYLIKNNESHAIQLINKIPDLGRFDDFQIKGHTEKTLVAVHQIIKDALEQANGLCAKWTPRKGRFAEQLRAFLGWSPKFYRKRLVELSKTVEQLMCAKKWNEINFSHVPSVASSRYQKAFMRNAPLHYNTWKEALVKGDVPGVKVNAAAIYPYQIIQALEYGDQTVAIAQWEALPNYCNDSLILPVVDVSGSMTTNSAGGSGSVSCMDVAVSLGLYLSDKNTGAFKDTFLTFTNKSQLITLKGNLAQKMDQMKNSDWQMNTNLHSAFDKILEVAVQNLVHEADMPKTILILSDMQFDECTRYDDSAIEMINRKYSEAGYTVPQVVFWNLKASTNTPARHNEKKVALVSGFSPSEMISILSTPPEHFTPQGVMLNAIMKERYSVSV